MGGLDATVSLLSVFSDPTRLRLMALLAAEELSVAELTRIMDVAQSRVSTHLGRLREAGLLRDRRLGASTLYAVAAGIPEPAAKLWASVSEQLDDGVIAADRERCAQLIAARESAGDWLDSIAGQMERHYSPGRTWEATARGLVGMLRLGDVLDIGAGDGVISELLSPWARSITLLDRSERMVEAAQKRIGHIREVQIRVGDMHELPFNAASFDQVLLYNSLTYAHTPARAVSEAARVCRPGGMLVVVTLNEHAHPQITAPYSHMNTGFSPSALSAMLVDSGLQVRSCEISSREKKVPYFEVVTAFAEKPVVDE